MHWWVKQLAEAYTSGAFPPLSPIEPDRRICWNEPVDKDEILKWLDNKIKEGEVVK